MKKFVAIISAALLCLCALCGCSGKSTGGGVKSEPLVSEEKITENLEYFLGITESKPAGDMGDRTYMSESERNAAKKLYDKYRNKENYSALEVTPMSISVKAGETTDEVPKDTATEFYVSYRRQNNDNTVTEYKRVSYNVEIRYRGNNTGGKQVILATDYDNAYGDFDEIYERETATGVFDRPNRSTGAYENATGVATLMSMIDYCNEKRPNLDFDIVFVFFGCGSYYSYGAGAYVKNMESEDRNNTLLMLNIGSLGGDFMYLYADDVETERERFLRDTATQSGLDYHALPPNMPIIGGVSTVEDVHYVNYAMLGGHSSFREWGVPSAYIFSGYLGGFNFSALESKGQSNIGSTADDTYQTLNEKRSAYKTQGSDTATLMLKAVSREGFRAAMEKGKASDPDYSFWAKPFWAYMIALFAVIALAVVLVVVVKVTEKRHPFVPTVKRMKVAVFGMDYEDKNDADIFIDVKPPQDPFE